MGKLTAQLAGLMSALTTISHLSPFIK